MSKQLEATWFGGPELRSPASATARIRDGIPRLCGAVATGRRRRRGLASPTLADAGAADTLCSVRFEAGSQRSARQSPGRAASAAALPKRSSSRSAMNSLELGSLSTASRQLFAKGNYAAFASAFHLDSSWQGPISREGRRMAEVTDGTSNSLLIGEVRTRELGGDPRGAWTLPWPGASLLAVDFHEVTSEDLDFAQTPNSSAPDVFFSCPEPADGSSN